MGSNGCKFSNDEIETKLKSLNTEYDNVMKWYYVRNRNEKKADAKIFY
jgi:hypothetical protein